MALDTKAPPVAVGMQACALSPEAWERSFQLACKAGLEGGLQPLQVA